MQIGISQCLLGEHVRYDGGHRKADFLLNIFDGLVELVPVCPEVEVGMGTPREPVQLRDARMIGAESGRDWTDDMQTYAKSRVETLGGLSAYILKSRSPSCGLDEGLFAKALRDRFPVMPMEQEDSLNDPKLLDNFIERTFAYRRLRTFLLARRSVGELSLFHAQSRLQLEVHEPGSYEQMCSLVGPFDTAAYQARFLSVIGVQITPQRQAEIFDELETELGIDLGVDIDGSDVIGGLRQLKEHVDKHKPPKLYGQTYLKTDDSELILRQRARL
ncbi:MAG: DUF523 and DUF1722 domain-containing protein [Actinomycetota bacterium]